MRDKAKVQKEYTTDDEIELGPKVVEPGPGLIADSYKYEGGKLVPVDPRPLGGFGPDWDGNCRRYSTPSR